MTPRHGELKAASSRRTPRRGPSVRAKAGASPYYWTPALALEGEGGDARSPFRCERP
jgi:hypothetical protein